MRVGLASSKRNDDEMDDRRVSLKKLSLEDKQDGLMLVVRIKRPKEGLERIVPKECREKEVGFFHSVCFLPFNFLVASVIPIDARCRSKVWKTLYRDQFEMIA